MLQHFKFQIDYEDIDRDVDQIVDRVKSSLRIFAPMMVIFR